MHGGSRAEKGVRAPRVTDPAAETWSPRAEPARSTWRLVGQVWHQHPVPRVRGQGWRVPGSAWCRAAATWIQRQLFPWHCSPHRALGVSRIPCLNHGEPRLGWQWPLPGQPRATCSRPGMELSCSGPLLWCRCRRGTAPETLGKLNPTTVQKVCARVVCTTATLGEASTVPLVPRGLRGFALRFPVLLVPSTCPQLLAAAQP